MREVKSLLPIENLECLAFGATLVSLQITHLLEAFAITATSCQTPYLFDETLHSKLLTAYSY